MIDGAKCSDQLKEDARAPLQGREPRAAHAV
jgi:hypothetical protein